MMATRAAYFKVSPKVLGPLGAEQLQDPALAILELVKNAWDADATRVAIVVNHKSAGGSIAVIDNGHGMTRPEFVDRWLVIGGSHKRGTETTENGRPLIGEKGLGRLSSFALGNAIVIKSARNDGEGFVAKVNWQDLQASRNLEDYEIEIQDRSLRRGTRIEISDLNGQWSSDHTAFLVTHAEFLASLPGQKFVVILTVAGKRQQVQDPLATVARLSEATMEVRVLPDGKPKIASAIVNGVDVTRIQFRDMKPSELDRRLAGLRISLKFFRRDEAARRLSGVLDRNEVTEVLERYQGVRVFREGINVPPYGLNKDDWAGLEKQRTATGGPTMVPGNSQLVGEVQLGRRAHPHMVVTAGRSGFADQSAVNSIANYVRWAARELGTARRAEQLGITTRSRPVPARVDTPKKTKPSGEIQIKTLFEGLARSSKVRRDPELREQVDMTSRAVTSIVNRGEETVRLYAQLASTGIAATSFAHELRTDFDVVSEAIDELHRGKRKPDRELLALLNDSWDRIRAFAALFKIIPIKLRRLPKLMQPSELKSATETILGLAPPDNIKTQVFAPSSPVRMVPVEFDSIVLNLVSNAVKAIGESSNRGAGIINVNLITRGKDLQIKVGDNGCGITKKVAEIMFEPLEGRFAEGTGMGLPIVKFIAERYDGTVDVSSRPPERLVTELVVVLRNVVG